MKNVDFKNVDIKGGFWKNRQDLNSKKTVYAVRDRFADTGRMEAMNCRWKEGLPNRPHFFWDSDVAKWIEGVAYCLEKGKNKDLESYIDGLIDDIAAAQQEDGYYNVYFTVVEPGKRWTDQDKHELYCAGHLMEAAVAYYEATGKRKFLDVMEKYAAHIEKTFIIDKTSAFEVPGHEEIELALVKMYKCTGNEKYLNMSKFFIDRRGQNNSKITSFPDRNMQQHLPVREQFTAEGHAVRAVYLYCAMADLAIFTGDEGLKNACERLFENITQKRMYITGGIGSTHLGEAFTFDYDLQNMGAYSESCAAIALMYFAKRMSLFDHSSKYADIIERILYNGLLSSTSLDGKSFFYENPLEIQPDIIHKRHVDYKNKPHFPITQRVEVFDCSCCPPNIVRTFATIGDYLYNLDGKTLFVNQYVSNEYNENDIVCSVQTDYPVRGDVRITAKGTQRIALRIPYWCENYRLIVNSKAVNLPVSDGFVYVETNGETTIEISFEMQSMLIEADPRVIEDAGRVALQRGPVVYCLEAVDNGENLRSLAIDKQLCDVQVILDEKIGIPSLEAKGYRKDVQAFSSLYQKVTECFEDVTLKFIPYFAFANRGESEMLIWIMQK